MIRKSIRVVAVLLIAGPASGAFIFSAFFYAPEPVYPYENATGLSSEEYFNQYTIPDFVITYSGASQITINKSFTSGFESADDFSSFYIVPQNNQGYAPPLLSSGLVYNDDLVIARVEVS